MEGSTISFSPTPFPLSASVVVAGLVGAATAVADASEINIGSAAAEFVGAATAVADASGN